MTTTDTTRPPTRLLLRHDVAFLETLEGTYVRTGGEGFMIRGRSAFAYVSALLPHLDGASTEQDLLDGLPEQHVASVGSLLACLREKRALIDVPGSGPEVPEDLAERFASQRSLLLHHGDDGSGFMRVVSARVRVVSRSARHRAALGECLRANGVGAGPDGEVVEAEDLPPHGSTRPVDVVVGLSPETHDGELVTLGERATAAGSAFLPLLRVGEEIQLGPWQSVADGPMLASALLRQAENGSAGAEAVLRTAQLGGASAPDDDVLSPGADDLAISMLGFELFKLVSGVIPSDLDGGLLLLDADTVETRVEPVVLHPLLAPVALEAPGVVGPGREAEPPEARPADDAAAYQRFSRHVHRRSGVLQQFADDAVPQMPLRAAVLEAAAVRREPFVVFGTDDVLSCRLRAMEQAAALHALRLHRRAAPFLGWLTLEGDEADGLVRAHDLEGRPQVVSRAALLASPASRRNTRQAPGLAGLAAGPTLDEATERAVCSLLSEKALDSVAAGIVALHPAEVAPTPLDGSLDLDLDRAGRELGVLARGARTEGLELRWYAGDASMAVAAVAVEGQSHALLAAGPTWSDAARVALLAVLGAHQLRGRDLVVSDPPGTRRVSLDHLPISLSEVPAESAAGSTVAERVARWRDSGHEISVVELTTPDLRGATHVVRAVETVPRS